MAKQPTKAEILEKNAQLEAELNALKAQYGLDTQSPPRSGANAATSSRSASSTRTRTRPRLERGGGQGGPHRLEKKGSSGNQPKPRAAAMEMAAYQGKQVTLSPQQLAAAAGGGRSAPHGSPGYSQRDQGRGPSAADALAVGFVLFMSALAACSNQFERNQNPSAQSRPVVMTLASVKPKPRAAASAPAKPAAKSGTGANRNWSGLSCKQLNEYAAKNGMPPVPCN